MSKSILIVIFILANSLCFAQSLQQIGNPNLNYSDFCLSRNGSTLFIGEENVLKAYNIETIDLLNEIHQIHAKKITAIEISSDSSIIVSGSMDSTIVIYDLLLNKALFQYKHSNYITSIAISVDRRFLLSGDASGTINIFDLKTLRRIENVSLHKGVVSAIVINRDNSFFISSGFDGKLKAGSLNGGLNSMILHEGTSPIRNVELNDNGNRILAVKDNGKTYFFKLEFPSIVKTRVDKHSYAWLVTSNWYSDEYTYVVGDSKGEIHIRSSFADYSLNIHNPIYKIKFLPINNTRLVLVVSAKDRGIFILSASEMMIK